MYNADKDVDSPPQEVELDKDLIEELKKESEKFGGEYKLLDNFFVTIDG